MERDISFVIRVCDAETGLSDLVRGVDESARSSCDQFEILIVDDASSEQTASEAHLLERELASVRVITHPFTIGFGSGIKSGLAHSRCPWLMNVPADGSFRPGDISKFVSQMDEHDLVIGYRPLRSRPLCHRAGIFTVRVILRLLFGVSARETNSPKLLRKDVLRVAIIESRGFAIGSEIIIKSVLRGARICHVLLSESSVPERKIDGRHVINGLVGLLELLAFFVMRIFKLADFDPTGEDKKRVLR
ncbi:MAG TPA: glycosyltransferase family 2 protein [bacterium]|nr:glycosyltransferase family 2 protein [bacterium]